jgi:hypothetical protein
MVVTKDAPKKPLIFGYLSGRRKKMAVFRCQAHYFRIVTVLMLESRRAMSLQLSCSVGDSRSEPTIRV